MNIPFFYKKLPDNQRELLQTNFSFYRKLSENNKRKFEHRVIQFIKHHHFVAKEGFEITQKTLLLIAGTAVMLSFGFKEYLYSLFATIIIYPDNYYSTLTNQNHKGETNPKFGVIVFSWEDFEAGLAVEDDNMHLGLHEFTHALHFSYKHTRSFEGTQFLNNFKKILIYMESKEVQKDLIDTGYIRSYAFENQYEFLAVLVEHFFETSEQFKEEHPVIYRLLIKLLKFDVNK